jgi:HTH-type transcriptional regulator/antitoxin MqsA
MDETCWLCGSPADLVTELREIPMGTRKVVVDDTFYRCTSCGEMFYRLGMGDETLARAAAKIRQEDGLLTPGEIRALRAMYGLSQAGLERLINSGEKTVVRWERGTVAQNATADTLLRVLRDHPEVVARLAEQRGVRVRMPEGERSAA